jgi:hypothetical protein
LALRAAGKVGDGTTLATFQPVDRSEAQKRDARFYEAGQAVFFLKRYGRHAKGDVCEVTTSAGHGSNLCRLSGVAAEKVSEL